MRLISSELALGEVLALAAADDISLTELAHSVASGPSAAQRALEILLADGLAERTKKKGRPRYRLTTAQRTDHFIWLAQAELPVDDALAMIARASPAVEFLARGADEVLVVFAPASRSVDQARAARLIDQIAGRLGGRVEYLDHDDVRRRLLDEPQLRSHASNMRILHGSLDRSFPDRSHHAVHRGRPLGKLHPALKLPSRHALQTLRRRHGLASLKLFGSAVRSDFRPDSDVDALIRYQPGTRPTMKSMAELEADLERLFGRDVQVAREDALKPEMRTNIESEAVPLL
jgi:uncharacterized protein